VLADKEMFDLLEVELEKAGKLAAFEKEYGKILGRIMIVEGENPDNLDIDVQVGGSAHAFICTFDFYDCEIGIVLDVAKMEVLSPLWVTPQVEGADAPSEDWVKFFIQTLVGSIEDGGRYGIPIYSFINDESDMTIVPTRPE